MSLYRKFFIAGSWQMAFRVNESHWPFDYNKPFIPIPNDENYWYADPLLFEDAGRVFLFCEAFNKGEQKGELAVLEWNNGKWMKPTVIISNNYHMSYPGVFKNNEKFYMIPESAECGKLELYMSNDFPYKWEKRCNIIDKVSFADPTVFEYEGTLYVYVWDETGGVYRGRVLRLNIDENRCEEVTTLSYSKNIARPAGPILKTNGKMVRPAQNSKRLYGESIFWYELHRGLYGFDEKVIDELDAKQVKVDGFEGEKRIHTFSSCSNIEVIDFCQYKFDFFKRVKILNRKMKKYLRRQKSCD